MKVAILTSGFLPVIDGVTVSGMHRLQYLSQWGHQVVLFCPDYRALAVQYPNWQNYTQTILPGIRVVNLKSTGFMGLDFERNVAFSSYKTLLKELESFQPDILHVDEPERLAMGFLRAPGVDFARGKKIPCVGFYRTNFLDYIEDYVNLYPSVVKGIKAFAQGLLMKIYHDYDVTLVSSQVTYQKLKEMGFRNLQYHNLLGFDAQSFCPTLREKNFFETVYDLPKLEDKIKLIFLGRMTPDKGWDFILKTFARYRENSLLDKVAILIAGDGNLRSQVVGHLKQITPEVYSLGRIPPEQVPALLANSDIHITASQKETRGLTVLEAFASGIPVLAPHAGGVVENIRHGWNGLLFTPNDSADFWQKLEVLVNDPEGCRQMGARGQETMEAYGWEQTVGNLVAVWESLIAERSAPPGGMRG